MIIGILTLPLHTNYGGILQAYALQTVLEQMGHEVCLIEKRKPSHLPIWKMPLSYGKRLLKNISGHPYPIFFEQKANRELPIIRQNTERFITKYIKRRFINTFSEINDGDYDAFVVGSDQIWRPIQFGNKIEDAYLSFAESWNIKRISYAASFGTDNWEYTPKQTANCKRLIQQFDAISVREKSGVDLCRKHFNVEATQVLDPTMLLDKEDYIQLFENVNTPKSKGTLFNYILDETPEKTALINKIANNAHLIPFYVNSKAENPSAPLEERIQPPIEQWLRGFYDAEYMVTDSFHGCVFSILFNKPFIAIGNEERGMSRFKSLLETFGLTDRLITNQTEISTLCDIDWQKINLQLDKNKEKTYDFIKTSI